jgi:Putative zinc-finger
MTTPMLTCDDAQALMPDLFEGTLSDTTRASYEAHVAQCAECRTLAVDLVKIRDDAAALPTFSPSRDLWSGIEARIDTPVVSLADRSRGAVGRWSTRQVAAAAAILIAVTAGGTWMAATRPATTRPSSVAVTAASAARTELVSVADQKGIATYVGEIGKLQNILQTRGNELDTATIAVLLKNLKLIDQAISESKAALAADPASPFLAGRLNHAYDTKLELLRSAAMLPSRT